MISSHPSCASAGCWVARTTQPYHRALIVYFQSFELLLANPLLVHADTRQVFADFGVALELKFPYVVKPQWHAMDTVRPFPSTSLPTPKQFPISRPEYG
jgi:hypothetical protein